jgi:hypothetical protein
MIFRTAASLVALCISTVLASVQSQPKEVATRAEIYPIPSLTLSDQQPERR